MHHALEDCSTSTALWLANRFCKTVDGEVEFLGERGQKLIDVQDNQGVSSIHLAMQSRNHSVLEMLERGGADFGMTGFSGKTALHYGAESQCFDNARYLIRQGLADIDWRNLEGETALMFAAGEWCSKRYSG